MGWIFGRILKTVGGVSRNLSPREYGTDLTSVSGRMCGAEKQLSSPYSHSSIL
jgi:hypothetical protein